jgi:hypothetical protein
MVHFVGCTIETYHDARPYKRQKKEKRAKELRCVTRVGGVDVRGCYELNA